MMNETDSVDLLCGNQQEEDYIVTMTEKIKLEICFDTQIQLYPLKVEQTRKEIMMFLKLSAAPLSAKNTIWGNTLVLG